MKSEQYTIEMVAPDKPADVKLRGVVYVERDGGAPDTPDVVQFYCPCGCDMIYRLNLDSRLHGSPHLWSLSIKDGKPTLKPSIDYGSGCRSHFSIIDGKVRWAGG